ncbi:hypothetical protein SBI63_31565 [Mycolicibacterium sp. 120270]|nr:hypothetical protein [Mycolicibacterium sp. 120270]MDX1887903.1 hypothetical protein [Mycolicibacterium sp. 120270]
MWPATALAALAAVLAGAALVVALVRSAATETAAPSAAPTYTAAEADAAQQKLCDAYRLAARAVQIETHGGGPALARVASVNGAVMLESAAAAPALAPSDRKAAQALAEAYRTATAVGSFAGVDDPEWRSAADDVNAKDAVMKEVCGG